MSSTSSKLSFTIRRPTPVSRASSTDSDASSFKVPAIPRHLSANSSARASPSPLARNSPTHNDPDSSDEEDRFRDELVTGFDQFGVQRLHKKPEPEGPLVIPALKDRDWRDLARKRKQLYIPPSAAPATGADGSVGGLGTKDSINSGPQLSGLQLKPKRTKEEKGEDEQMADADATAAEAKEAEDAKVKTEAETDDERALRAVLAAAQSTDENGTYNGPIIDIIPTPVNEDDAYKQDVAVLPESASLQDYERVPVSQFGAALLRGMGWKEGEVASRSKRFHGKGQDGKQKGLIEPWVPTARPALLGIGAKEKELLDDGSTKKKFKGRPDKKYIPVVKVEKGGEGGSGGEREGSGRSGSSSRRRSPEPSRGGSSRRSLSPAGRDRDRERRYRDKDTNSDAGRTREKTRDRGTYKDDGGRDRERDKGRDYGDDSSRRNRDDRRRDRERSPDQDRERYGDSGSRRKDRDRRDL